MTTYSFKVTKGRYQLSLTTTDRDMVVEQFEMWVRKASECVQGKKEQYTAASPAAKMNAERELTQRKVEEQLKQTNKVEENKNDTAGQQSVDKSFAQRDLDAIYSAKTESQGNRPTIETENPEVQNVFDTLLDKSMQTPQSELSFKPNPSIKKDNAFLNYISSRKVDRKIDYLLMTAYYFTQYDQKPRFTLKQLNAKLMQNIAIILDHSVIQEAINRDYIECLPDLTGVVGASEYRLTAYGEKTLLESE